MNRIDRLMGMTLFLQGRRVSKAEDMAARFEISVRTVYRDMAALSEVGVPIVAEAGVGYRLMKGYFLPPIMFTEEEAAAMGMAAMALRRTSDPSMEKSISGALMKIRAALPQAQRDRLERIENSVAFGWPSEKSNTEVGVARIVDIQSCLADSRLLRIDYRAGSRNEATGRSVEPLGLVRYLEKWHLIAWCRLREDVRDFRLDRIERMEVSGEQFEKRADFDLNRYLDRENSEKIQIETRLFFQSHYVDRAKRQWSRGLVSEERVEGGSILVFATGELDWMIGWLLSFRDAVTVIEPLELKERLREEAKKLAAFHA